jgi:hypothetical protein
MDERKRSNMNYEDQLHIRTIIQEELRRFHNKPTSFRFKESFREPVYDNPLEFSSKHRTVTYYFVLTIKGKKNFLFKTKSKVKTEVIE